jgi:hypothetical protein
VSLHAVPIAVLERVKAASSPKDVDSAFTCRHTLHVLVHEPGAIKLANRLDRRVVRQADEQLKRRFVSWDEVVTRAPTLSFFVAQLFRDDLPNAFGFQKRSDTDLPGSKACFSGIEVPRVVPGKSTRRRLRQ